MTKRLDALSLPNNVPAIGYLILLFCLLASPLSVRAAPQPSGLADLEKATGGRLGVYAEHTGTGRRVMWREGERFPMCSTFKAALAGAVLKQAEADSALLDRLIGYTEAELITWSPVTQRHVATGLTVRELCEAAVTQSDNTAANLLLKLVGGPEGLTAFLRSIGDAATRIDRWEPELNEALPADERDTTSPIAMAGTLKALVVGDTLSPAMRGLLGEWMTDSQTGLDGLRAGIPSEWIVGYKTGSGAYGTTNCIAVIWSPCGSPILLTVYFTQTDQDAPNRPEILREAARLALKELGVFSRSQP